MADFMMKQHGPVPGSFGSNCSRYLKMMKFVLKMIDFAFKMMDFVSKMMSFALKMSQLQRGAGRLWRAASVVKGRHGVTEEPVYIN